MGILSDRTPPEVDPEDAIHVTTTATVLDPMAHCATTAGGNTAFGVSTGFVTLAASSEVELCAFVNPANSGKDIYLDLGEFAATVDTHFRRYSVASTGITVTGTAETVRNLGGGSTASVAKMYTPANYSATGGTVGKVALIKGYYTYFTFLRGRSILRPGRALYWTIDGKTGAESVVYLEWWEKDAA